MGLGATAGLVSSAGAATLLRAPSQWALSMVGVSQAWSRTQGERTTVAVIDSGINPDHPDLAGAVVASVSCVTTNGDSRRCGGSGRDTDGHGTAVAGVVAGRGVSGGTLGVAPAARLMAIKVFTPSCLPQLAGGALCRLLSNPDDVTAGIHWAVDHGAQVINLSLEFLPSQVSSSAEIPLIVSAIDYAHRKDVVVVGAAGNDQASQIAYPARAAGVISVGASTRDRCLADYSNIGAGLDLVAPGGGDDAILPADSDCHPERNLPAIYQLTLTDPGHWDRFGYPNFYIGTSMSSPQVAAAAALVISSRVIGRRPTPNEVLLRLIDTATALGGSQPNSTYGWGLLNVGAATDPNAPVTPIHLP
jgi:serine protease